MDCKEFKTLVTDLFDKDVDPHIKAECEEHISQCSECKEYYEELQATAELLSPKHTPVIPISYNRWLSSPIQKIAAIVLAAVFLGGLAWAISPHILSSEANSPQSTQVSTPRPAREGQRGGATFSNQRLDSILTVVAAHYGLAVCFRDTTAPALRMNMVWDSRDSLAVFIETLNEFDRLRLTNERDTIFVESEVVEDKE